ncbi:hypothetical protein M2323_002035 [Rhodoblastus acidophilus]|uniref:hypothetical protein n=1 Tax=Rhodoblastus acidophilus TaxID=1074 RepID=UPI0016102EC9|nr:hypothetical protein [Rhodoblastus acidophilus]MCW2285741.1 hypothetical protein [Rhodoblastus acidophilus]MCW2333113.1 hypothetical protein [Rhodoblastus acidophilus]
MDSQFGIGVTPQTLSLLQLFAVLPLVIGLLASFKMKSKKGTVLVSGFVLYLLVQGFLYFFVHAAA